MINATGEWLLPESGYNPSVFAGKPIIGIAGGIGSGKSFVAGLIGEMGFLVLNSDDLARQAYEDPRVRQELQRAWGSATVRNDGTIDRSGLAKIIFNAADDRRRLERLIHPVVAEKRSAAMQAAAQDPSIQGFVWDSPLLFETGLNSQCDAVVFVEAPLELRARRVSSNRGWSPAELTEREKSQWPLDKKRAISHDVIRNAAGADEVRAQVRPVLSRITEKTNASR